MLEKKMPKEMALEKFAKHWLVSVSHFCKCWKGDIKLYPTLLKSSQVIQVPKVLQLLVLVDLPRLAVLFPQLFSQVAGKVSLPAVQVVTMAQSRTLLTPLPLKQPVSEVFPLLRISG
jgi:hypothetical protein